ncbi:DUF4326 domain-containing protein [Streptomyces tricolor]|uniref:DUF4326 domain-containing protein n=1 Tax=Streptomyces tricolor TaxID=68277 RepID=A0ABS9JK97_9ACTN|nr:DUF4326 domain-containing protein [Streptomyces tricolor]MCG0065968.1 DUF4326 domain-containing protein [Streptomyces tricolor]
MTPKPFDPEMNGGRQLDLFGQELAISAEQPAVTGPTTVVCLKGRRDDPEIQGVVYVGRPMYQGGWRLHGHPLANPYRVGKHGTAEEVVARYEAWLDSHRELVARELPKLRGHRLGCWCREGDPCHARVLAERADAAEVPPCG